MKTQVFPELFDSTPKIKGRGRRLVNVSSLRPGDWIALPARDDCDHDEYYYCILINSAKLRRIHLRTWSDDELTLPYDHFSTNYRLVGSGKPRYWHFFLPRWLRARVHLYSFPS